MASDGPVTTACASAVARSLVLCGSRGAGLARLLQAFSGRLLQAVFPTQGKAGFVADQAVNPPRGSSTVTRKNRLSLLDLVCGFEVYVEGTKGRTPHDF